MGHLKSFSACALANAIMDAGTRTGSTLSTGHVHTPASVYTRIISTV